MEEWHLYTDGACQPNPGSGGWAFILRHHISTDASAVGMTIEYRSMCQNTTNNRMEMQAVIEGLRYFLLNEWQEDSTLILYSDSLYLIDGIENWSEHWATNGWIKKNGDPVLNQDLWDEICLLRKHLNLRCIHVKGHSGDQFNERVDKLAFRAAEKAKQLYKSRCRTTKTESEILPVG